MAAGADERLRRIVESAAAQAGFDLEELAVVAAGRRRLVRVVIDTDGGVSLDAAAEFSREISGLLDADPGSDPMGGQPYTLEVTSPGVGRPLTAPRHFRRARGRLLSVTTHDGRDLMARVLAADDAQVTLLAPGEERIVLAYPEIARAKVEVEFNPPTDPGPWTDDAPASAGNEGGTAR